MADEHTKEVVVFEDPHLKPQKSTPADTTQQQTNQQNDQQEEVQSTDTATQQGVQEGIKQGVTEITKTEIKPEKAIVQSGQQEGIKEAVKEATKTQKVSEKTFKEQGQHEGIKEAAKDAAKGKEETTGKLDRLVKNAQQPLLKLQTSGYLMLNLKPDILTIDALKVTVRYRSILGDEKARSVFIKDIGDVYVESIPFAASLRIIDNTDKDNPILIKPFKNADAEKAKSIIKGLMTAQKEDIDTATLEQTDETVKKIEALGEENQ